jgi:two-component system, OmpR family, response regulator
LRYGISENNTLFSRAQKSVQKDLGEKAPAVFSGIGPTIEAQKKVLVVDDDPVIVEVLTMMLEGRGYAVCSAASGAEAIRMVRAENPDMLLVDVSLPADAASGDTALWDGFQITRFLRHVSAKRIPAIIMSASDKADYKKYAAMVGAEAFLSKPISSAKLFQSIESALTAR